MTSLEAIDVVRNMLLEHRQSHVNWKEYYEKFPEKEALYVTSAGDKVRQIKMISEHDEALEALDIIWAGLKPE